MKSSVRPARNADLDGVAAVSAAGWTRAQFEAEIGAAGSVFLVAERAGAAAGHALARLVLDEAQIVDVAVRADARREGLGSGLLAALLSEAEKRGARRATLEVSAANAPALALYRAAGFVVVGRRPNFYNDGSDAVLMDRKIP